MFRLPLAVSMASSLLLAACGGGSARMPGLIGADCAAGRDGACASGNCLVDDDCPAGLKCDGNGAHGSIPVSRSACGPCTSDLQCGSGSCHADAAGERFCVSACGAGAGCATGFSCKAAEGGQRCLPNAGSCRGGRPLCAPCAGDLECGGIGDLCVRNLQSQEMFCTVHCKATTDCAQGFSCLDLTGTGAGPSQCLPDSGTCAGYCEAQPGDGAAAQRECGLGATCDFASRRCLRNSDGSLCAACQTDDDCIRIATPNSRCVSNRTPGSLYLGERFCGSDCGSTLGCTGAGCTADQTRCAPFGPQFTCAPIGTGGKPPFQCVPLRGSCTAGFARLGDSCEKSGAADCLSAVCARFGTERRRLRARQHALPGRTLPRPRHRPALHPRLRCAAPLPERLLLPAGHAAELRRHAGQRRTAGRLPRRRRPRRELRPLGAVPGGPLRAEAGPAGRHPLGHRQLAGHESEAGPHQDQHPELHAVPRSAEGRLPPRRHLDRHLRSPAERPAEQRRRPSPALDRRRRGYSRGVLLPERRLQPAGRQGARLPRRHDGSHAAPLAPAGQRQPRRGRGQLRAPRQRAGGLLPPPFRAPLHHHRQRRGGEVLRAAAGRLSGQRRLRRRGDPGQRHRLRHHRLLVALLLGSAPPRPGRRLTTRSPAAGTAASRWAPTGASTSPPIPASAI